MAWTPWNRTWRIKEPVQMVRVRLRLSHQIGESYAQIGSQMVLLSEWDVPDSGGAPYTISGEGFLVEEDGTRHVPNEAPTGVAEEVKEAQEVV